METQKVLLDVVVMSKDESALTNRVDLITQFPFWYTHQESLLKQISGIIKRNSGNGKRVHIVITEESPPEPHTRYIFPPSFPEI